MDYGLVTEAMSGYDIPESEAILLRHNENMTFRVGTDYLLQIHEPVQGFETQHLYEGLDRMAVYETEIRFLGHLKNQGMMSREPVKNRRGQWITKLDNGNVAMVSRWIEGESLDKMTLCEKHYYRIGLLAAELHRCAKGFRGFPAISYDGRHVERIGEKLRALEGNGLACASCRALERACDAVGTALRKAEGEFQMLHADLSLSNILQTKAGLAAIDFSLFGMGHPMLDIAVLFGNIGGLACREKIAEGYRDGGGRFDYEALDACFVLTILDCIAIHFGQWCRESWFEDRMKRWSEESLEPFARGERLLADDFCIIHAGN